MELLVARCDRRAVIEDITEEELAMFDLLTQPEPVLDDAQREVVKASAKRLLHQLHEKLVLDWRRKAVTMADVRMKTLDVLDAAFQPTRTHRSCSTRRCRRCSTTS